MPTTGGSGGSGVGTRARDAVNRVLRRYVGYELRSINPPPGRPVERVPKPPKPKQLDQNVRKARAADRLVPEPAFVLSSVRSGSTLLRLILDSHPEICAPYEMHLRRFSTKVDGKGREAMKEMGLDEREVRNLLWDRLLHLELTRSGKSVFVNKTPNDALIWADILACWPKARFIFLRRHPAAIVDSWVVRRPRWTRDQAIADVLAYATGMQQAYEKVGGLVVRYEDLTGEPERETRRICEFLGVQWTPAMIDYGRVDHEGMRRGLGDWSDTVHAGTVRTAEVPPPGSTPALLQPIADAWGYR